MEARVGIEPTHKAFAEPCLTTWLPRRPLRKLNHFPHHAKILFLLIIFPLKSQLFPPRPYFARLENPCWRNNASDQFRRRHIESRIARPALRIPYTHISVSS